MVCMRPTPQRCGNKEAEGRKSRITDNISESVGAKDPFVQMPAAAMTCTAPLQSMDATVAIHPIVFASMTQE